MLLWKIAWRNVWRHYGRSLIIGAILFSGALLMTVGNAVINGAQQGFEENWASRLTQAFPWNRLLIRCLPKRTWKT